MSNLWRGIARTVLAGTLAVASLGIIAGPKAQADPVIVTPGYYGRYNHTTTRHWRHHRHRRNRDYQKRHEGLAPYGDRDRDGVPNYLDRRPRAPLKH